MSALVLTSCIWDSKTSKSDYLKSGNRYFEAAKYREAVIEFRGAIQMDQDFAEAHAQLGRAYLALGNAEAAQHEFKTTVTLDPANSKALLSLASLQMMRREYADAQKTLQRVLSMDAGNAQAHIILARKYLVTKDLPAAIEEFRKVIELDPGGVTGYGGLGAAYLAAGRPADAEAAYSLATEKSPKSVEAHIAMAEFYLSRRQFGQAETEIRAACALDRSALLPHLMLARTLAAGGQMAEAERVYADLKNVAPNDMQAYRALGDFYSVTGQKAKALAEFRSLEILHPQDDLVKTSVIETLVDLNRTNEASPLIRAVMKTSRAYKNRAGNDRRIPLLYGRILMTEGNYTEAVAAIQKIVTSEPGSATAHYYLGLAQRAAGQTGPAKISLAHALELAPQMSQAAAALSSLNARDGNRDDALKQADVAIAGNPAGVEGYVSKARALIAKGNSVQGAAVLDEALRRDPLNLPALATLVNFSISQGRSAESVRRLETLLQANSGNASLHFLLALAEFSLKDVDRAETEARRVLALDPRMPQFWTLMANIDFARGRTENAKSDLRKAIAANSQTISNYTTLGMQYEREQNWAEATRLFERAHDLDRNAPFVAAELAFIYLEHGGDRNVALSLAQQAKRGMPTSPITADALGWAYYKLGSTGLAIKELEESVHMVPANPVYQYHLGMAYASDRRWDKAARSLRAALKEGPGFPYADNARTTLDQVAKHSR